MVIKIIKNFKNLCIPAKIETVLSIIGIASLIVSCLTNTSKNKLQMICIDIIPYSMVSIIFVFLLNTLCKGGAKIISWVLVLAPLISILLTIFISSPKEYFINSIDENIKKIEEEQKDEEEKEARKNKINQEKQISLDLIAIKAQKEFKNFEKQEILNQAIKKKKTEIKDKRIRIENIAAATEAAATVESISIEARMVTVKSNARMNITKIKYYKKEINYYEEKIANTQNQILKNFYEKRLRYLIQHIEKLSKY